MAISFPPGLTFRRSGLMGAGVQMLGSIIGLGFWYIEMKKSAAEGPTGAALGLALGIIFFGLIFLSGGVAIFLAALGYKMPTGVRDGLVIGYSALNFGFFGIFIMMMLSLDPVVLAVLFLILVMANMGPVGLIVGMIAEKSRPSDQSRYPSP